MRALGYTSLLLPSERVTICVQMITGRFKLRCSFLLDNWQIPIEDNGDF